MSSEKNDDIVTIILKNLTEKIKKQKNDIECLKLGLLDEIHNIRLYGYSFTRDYIDGRHSLLYYAIKYGMIDVIKQTIGSVYDIEHDCIYLTNSTPLIIASAEGKSTEVVELLLNMGSNINVIDDFKRTPLIYASANGQNGIVKCLLDHGANVDIKCDDGFNSLFYACQYDFDYIVKILLESGANPNIVNDFGDTPLGWAKKNKNKKIIKMLIDYMPK